MHIFKSRNPIWLILDVIIAVWLWRIPLLIPAFFFTIDSIVQLIYTFFPELIDTYEKKRWTRVLQAIFLILSLVLIFLELSKKGFL